MSLPRPKQQARPALPFLLMQAVLVLLTLPTDEGGDVLGGRGGKTPLVAAINEETKAVLRAAGAKSSDLPPSVWRQSPFPAWP